MKNDCTIFLARKIITMNPEQPFARAVAVKDGRILAIGEALYRWVYYLTYLAYWMARLLGRITGKAHGKRP